MLLVHRSERADCLVESLGDLLLDAPVDPMAREIVAVPTRGVERWLTQRLSHRLGVATGAPFDGAAFDATAFDRTDGGPAAATDGICANVEFPFPGSLVQQAMSVACGLDPEDDPWPPDRSVWPLLELVDENLEAPWLQPLVAHLEAGSPDAAEGPGGLRRFATIRHLADLYDRYAVHRPDMILRWAEGLERSGDAAGPVGATAIPEPDRGATDDATDSPGGWHEQHWQARLWRCLRRSIGVPSLAERLRTAEVKLAEEPDLLDLPARLSLFGLTSLPASHLRIFDAIGRTRDVHLFLLHPSGRLWSAVERAIERADGSAVGSAVGGAAGTLPRRLPERANDPTLALVANPLLRSWGRDAREMQLVLGSRGATRGEHRPVPEPADGSRTLLQRLQSDVRADVRPVGEPGADRKARPRAGTAAGAEPDARPALDPGDDSLRVHSCHGRLRQVEVMRDAVLHLLARDPTLEPRDVIVMCPDIESFAPLVNAVFGSSSQPASGADPGDHAEREPGPPQIRVRLADRSIRQTNPVLAVAAQLLELAAGRVTASEVLDLAGREPVARRFHFDEDERGQLERWVVETGVRWGLDRVHRARWHLDDVGDNTWQSGLDRLLLGVAMAEEEQRLYAGILPLDDVSSGAVELAGRFAELLERLGEAVERLQGRHPIGDWVETLVGATESLALAAPHEQWQHDQLRRVLGDVIRTAAAAPADVGGGGDPDGVPSGSLLDLAEVRSLLDDRLRGRPTRANFRTGDLTVCTLVPMRSVPHRVIGLLGLDDGAFPRHGAQDGDDLLLGEPLVGDRDARSEDRQLLLDALLAATDHVILTYEGHDPRTNQERAPCVPVAELLDVVDRTVRVPEGSPRSRAREHVVVEHPLQSFDPRNFEAGQLAGDAPWSFDPVDLAGARSHVLAPLPRRRFLARPLERVGTEVVQLDALVTFLEFPVRAFLRERLGWHETGGADQVKDSLPVQLDNLEQWGVGDRMLDAVLGGAALNEARSAEQGRGLLPPGALATRYLGDIDQVVEALAKATREEIAAARAAPGAVEIDVRLHGGRSLQGPVPDVYEIDPRRGPGTAPGSRIVRCVYSNLAPKHRLAAWARFLAFTAAHPDREVVAVTIGRSPGDKKSGPRTAVAQLPPLAGTADERRETALRELAVLVDLYDRGMCEPLPLYPKTSEAYVEALKGDGSAKSACKKAWDVGDYSFGEGGEPEYQLVYGGIATVDDLLGEAPHEDESGPGWTTEPSRLGRLARRLWEPVLEHEHREVRP